MIRFLPRQKWILGLMACVPVAFVFQNCGKVSVHTPEELERLSPMSVSKGEGQICVQSGYTLESVYVTNLNARIVNSKLVADSDGDGLPDDIEDQLGTSPIKRRTSGQVLDSICQKVDYQVSCQNLQLSCTGAAAGWGLSDCDVEALQLDMLYEHPKQGLDSDKDGIPDYLEVRAGTFPNISDNTQDIDHDYRTNGAEIETGTDPGLAEMDLDEEILLQVSRSKLTASQSCPGGQLWQIEVLNLPITPVKEFVSASENQFSHAENQNVISVIYKVRPLSGGTAKARLYSHLQKIDYVRPNNPKYPEVLESLPLNFSAGEFNLEGEVLP